MAMPASQRERNCGRKNAIARAVSDGRRQKREAERPQPVHSFGNPLEVTIHGWSERG